MELNPTKMGTVVATTAIIGSAVCGIAYWISPQATIAMGTLLTHAQVQYIPTPLEPTQFILGLVAWAIIGFAGGWVFATLFNKLHG